MEHGHRDIAQRRKGQKDAWAGNSGANLRLMFEHYHTFRPSISVLFVLEYMVDKAKSIAGIALLGRNGHIGMTCRAQ
jgi:hypothetical protein